MASPLPKSVFPVSLFATPNPIHQEIFYTVPRAGHLLGGPDHRIDRDHFPGHELIFCLRGQGYVQVAGRAHPVCAGQFVWINCQRPHVHGAHQSDPWEVFWVRIEGPRLMQMCEILSVGSSPVFDGFDPAATSAIYRTIFGLMAADRPEGPALIHAQIAALIAMAFAARQWVGGSDVRQVPSVLRKPIEHVRLFYFQEQRVSELAGLAGMSSSHFSRLFKATFGTSPIDWVRRERINQAKRRLAESSDQIQEIAEQVGYSDRFFFSKDFRRLTGITPRQFRQRESGRLDGSLPN